MNAELLLEIITSNEQCPLDNASIYFTCKRTYRQWHNHRDRVVLNMIIAHGAYHRAINPPKTTMVHNAGPVMWGRVRLDIAHESYFSKSILTACARAPDRYNSKIHCECIHCRVFRIEILYISAVYIYDTALRKYDAINGIHYTLTAASRDYHKVIRELYDCSLLPWAVHYVDITIKVDSTSRGDEILIYWGSLIVGSGDHKVDNMRLSCSSLPMPSGNTELYRIISDNIHNIIAYMRSMSIDSVAYMGPRFIELCSQ